MDKDKDKRPSPPRTKFTFLPSTEYVENVAGMGAVQVFDLMDSEPDLITPLLHELWRNHRDEDIYQVMGDSLGDTRFNTTIVGDGIVDLLTAARVEHGESQSTCYDFLHFIYTTRTQVYTGKELHDSLDKASELDVDALTYRMSKRIKQNYTMATSVDIQ